MTDSGIGSRVRAARKAKSLSQKVVADLAGMSKSALSMYESGERPLDRLSTIAFMSAERLAAEVVRSSPLVRETTGHILCRASRAAVPSDLRSFAHRVGATP
jgi:transcriptional regulator with XRE-family HTH domain